MRVRTLERLDDELLGDVADGGGGAAAVGQHALIVASDVGQAHQAVEEVDGRRAHRPPVQGAENRQLHGPDVGRRERREPHGRLHLRQ